MKKSKHIPASAKHPPLLAAGFILTTLVLMLWASTDGKALIGSVVVKEPFLSSCSREDVDDLFWYDLEKDPDGVLKELSEKYHQTVSDIVDEYIEQVKQSSKEAVQCDAEEYEILLTPGEKLKELAEQLPLWKDTDEKNYLGQGSISAVLNEYLRLYECSLAEFNLILVNPNISKAETQYGVLSLPAFSRSVQHEIIVTRATLNRVLTALSGLNRLQPIDAELTCLQRGSVDVRNAFALTAEASACLPRVWDTRDVLKDL